jgi:hypothetical protein
MSMLYKYGKDCRGSVELLTGRELSAGQCPEMIDRKRTVGRLVYGND